MAALPFSLLTRKDFANVHIHVQVYENSGRSMLLS